VVAGTRQLRASALRIRGATCHERLRTQAVHAPLRVDPRFGETGFSEYPPVFRYRTFREAEVLFAVADR
jgi:hypothetical protein